MVGTAVYQVGRQASSQGKKLGAWKPGGHTTLAPATNEDRRAPTRPWIWNNGMIFKQRSDASRVRDVATW
jgi:hypothetical protein